MLDARWISPGRPPRVQPHGSERRRLLEKEDLEKIAENDARFYDDLKVASKLPTLLWVEVSHSEDYP